MARTFPLTLLALVAALAMLPGVAGAAPLVRAEVDARKKGARLPSSFLGVSQEYNQTERFTGNEVIGYNAATGALFQRLRRFGSGEPVLRLGGVSTDATWFNDSGAPKPPGINITMTSRMVRGLATFARRSGIKLLPGLNLAAGTPAYAIEELRALAGGISKRDLLAFEIGNEPDFYPHRPMYEREDGSIEYARGRSYGPTQWGREIREFTDALRPYARGIDLAGPSISLVPKWTRAMTKLLRGNARGLRLATVHNYPLFACERSPGDPDYPTVGRLLAPETVKNSATAVQQAVWGAAKARRLVRVTESGGVACGGAHTVSNSQAAALWLVDHLFSMWLVGAQGVDMHAASPLYRPFGTSYDGTHHAVVSAPYYGMLVFGEATANRSYLLPQAAFGQRVRRRANVRLWATYDARRRTVRVVVLNKDLRRSGSASLRIPGARRKATLKRLRAPSARSFQDITWAGQSFAVPTDDGSLSGRKRVQRVTRRKGSKFIFAMPKTSAALLTVKLRRRR